MHYKHTLVLSCCDVYMLNDMAGHDLFLCLKCMGSPACHVVTCRVA